jgi:hypothetical protein
MRLSNLSWPIWSRAMEPCHRDLARPAKRLEGGERCIDVIEFLVITAAIGAGPIKIIRALRASKP